MLKNKLNLRNVAMLIACLAVTTMFASCGETNGNNGNGSGSKGTFKLKIYQGYDFQNKRVVEYVIRARDGRYYLLHLLNQENYDAIMPWTTTPANWVFTFDWKEITVK